MGNQMMDNVQGLGLLAIMAGGLFLAYKYMGFGGSDLIYQAPIADNPPVTTRWCESLGRDLDASLTCPVSARSYVNPLPTCGIDEYYDGRVAGCVPIPGSEPTASPVYIPGFTTMCTWPDGVSPLNIPSNMDCLTAQQIICQRFPSGYKGCP